MGNRKRKLSDSAMLPEAKKAAFLTPQPQNNKTAQRTVSSKKGKTPQPQNKTPQTPASNKKGKTLQPQNKNPPTPASSKKGKSPQPQNKTPQTPASSKKGKSPLVTPSRNVGMQKQKTPQFKQMSQPIQRNTPSPKQQMRKNPSSGVKQKKNFVQNGNSKLNLSFKTPDGDSEEEDDDDEDDDDEIQFKDPSKKLSKEDLEEDESDDDDDEDDSNDENDEEEEDSDDEEEESDDEEEEETSEDEDETVPQNQMKQLQSKMFSQGKMIGKGGDNMDDEEDEDDDDDDSEEEEDSDDEEEESEDEDEPEVKPPQGKKSQGPKQTSVTGGGKLTQEDADRRRDRNSRTLFVKNLPDSCSVKEVKALSKDIKQVRLRIVTRYSKKKQKQNPGFAFLEFDSEAVAEKNYKELQKSMLRGSQLTVDYVGEKSQYQGKKSEVGDEERDPLRLYIAGFLDETTEADIRKLFPKATEIALPPSKDKKTRGYGFVTFSTAAIAKQYHDRQEVMLKNRPLVVLYAKKRKDRQAAPAKSTKAQSQKVAKEPPAKKMKLEEEKIDEDEDSGDDDDEEEDEEEEDEEMEEDGGDSDDEDDDDDDDDDDEESE